MLSSSTLSLGRRQALPLAVASIAGSGILFLPSAVYVRAGGDSGWVRAAATALGLPMLLLFVDVVPSAPPGRAVPRLVGQGLGRRTGRCVPVLFVAIVVPGLPAGAVVAGDCAIAYVRLRELTWRSILNALFLIAVVPALVRSGWPALYGLAVTAAALVAQPLRNGRSANEDEPCDPGNDPCILF